MSLEETTYIGPYLRCNTHLVPKEETKKACDNPFCAQYGSKIWDAKKKFCEECGKPISDMTNIIQVANVDSWELQMKINERLHVPSGDTIHELMKKENIHLWISNATPPEADYYVEKYDSGFRSITEKTIWAECQKFAEFFKEEIETIEEAYAGKVLLQWGWIRYYS